MKINWTFFALLLFAACVPNSALAGEAGPSVDQEEMNFTPAGAVLLDDYQDIDTGPLKPFKPYYFRAYKNFLIYSDFKEKKLMLFNPDDIESFREIRLSRPVLSVATDQDNDLIVAAGQSQVYCIHDFDVKEFGNTYSIVDVVLSHGKIYALHWDYKPKGFRGIRAYDYSLKQVGEEAEIPDGELPLGLGSQRRCLACLDDDSLFLYYHLENDFRLITSNNGKLNVGDRMALFDDPGLNLRARTNYDTYFSPESKRKQRFDFVGLIPAHFEYEGALCLAINNFGKNSIVACLQGEDTRFFELADTQASGSGIAAIAIINNTLYAAIASARGEFRLRAYDLPTEERGVEHE